MKSSVIKFTKIKQFYLPIDADAYKALKALQLPLIRIHENLMPTIGIVFKKHKVSPQLVNFKDQIMDPYLDEIGRRWQAKEHRVATLGKSVLKFETTHASIHNAAREAIHKLEASLRRFFTRWGFTAAFEISESRGKLKLHVNYRYDPDREPIIPLVEDSTSMPKVMLNLGFIRLTLTLMKKEVEVSVAEAAGAGWNSILTRRCLYTQFSDVRPMLAALAQIVNMDQHNSDNKK